MSLLSPSPVAGAELRHELQRAIEHGQKSTVERLLAETIDTSWIDGHDLKELALRRERLARLSETLDQQSETTTGAYALGLIVGADRDLDRKRTRALGERQRRKRRAAQATIREELLEMLQTPLRPRDIAKRLRVDPSQASRALRALLDDGHIVRTEQGAGDRRSTWYALAGAAGTPAANASRRPKPQRRHVEPRPDGRWQDKAEGASRPAGVYATQAEAAQAAAVRVSKQRGIGEVVIHAGGRARR